MTHRAGIALEKLKVLTKLVEDKSVDFNEQERIELVIKVLPLVLKQSAHLFVKLDWEVRSFLLRYSFSAFALDVAVAVPLRFIRKVLLVDFLCYLPALVQWLGCLGVASSVVQPQVNVEGDQMDSLLVLQLLVARMQVIVEEVESSWDVQNHVNGFYTAAGGRKTEVDRIVQSST